MKHKVLIGLAALLVAAIPSAFGAPILFGTIGAGGGASTLVQLNPATGALVSTIGSVGYAVNGMTWDPVSGKLYGSTSVNDPVYNGLIEINPLTGAGTPVGVIGWGLDTTAAVTNITVNASGQMFGWWDPNEDDLVSIDKSTGIATRVGESGADTAINGLSFNGAGTLYMVNYDGHYMIDTTTGAATFVDSLGTIAHHGDFSLIDGLYYGIDESGNGVNPRNLVVADLTANTYILRPTVDDLHTLTFYDADGTVIPEPGTMVLLAAGLGILAFRRRRATR